MALEQTFIGRRIKRDIITREGKFLLSKNTLLQRVHLTLLAKNEIFLEKEDVLNSEEAVIQETAEQIKEIFSFTKESKQVPLTEIQRVIIPNIQQLSEKQDVFTILSQLQSKDDYTYRHNIGVCALSTLIGTWINLNAADLSALSTAALLHDIGKVGIPNDILNRPGKLTDTEFQIMKRHTNYGYEILKNTKYCEEVYSTVAIEHHESYSKKRIFTGTRYV